MSPRPKLTHFGRENAEGIRLALAKKAAEKTAPANRSWWIGTTRAEFRAEVQRRHACVLNSRNPSVRSLGKVI